MFCKGLTAPVLHYRPECRYQSLCQPKAEHQFRPGHQHLRRQSFEERQDALILEHLRDDPKPTLWVLKVSVLYPGLDHVQGRTHDQARGGSGHRCHEVLSPGGLVVVFQLEYRFFSPCAAAEERKGARRIPGSGPACTTVEPHTFISNDAEEASITECFRVCLAFDLEDVQGKEDDFADTDHRAGRCIEDRLSCAFAEGLIEVLRVVEREVIANEGLTAVLVYSLEDFVAGGIAETGEEGGELSSDRRRGIFFKDNIVEGGDRGDLR
jgi:hypothetical protein